MSARVALKVPLIRAANSADDVAVLALLRASLGWDCERPNEELFRWKHQQNPAGASPAWVAELDGEIIGFRTFLRWRFHSPTGDLPAVRAVDTATHPDHQGRGVFRRLTLHALQDLTAAGAAFVFNTPNGNSTPGYLRMGWRPVGRLPLGMTVGGAAAGLRVLRARTAADRWSLPTRGGDPAADVLARPTFLNVDGDRSEDGVATVRTPEHLRWRYGFAPLNYRAIVTADDRAAIIFRLRTRGSAKEAAVCEVFASDRATRRRLVREAVRATGADYALTLGTGRTGLPLPGQGPLLVRRALSASAPARVEQWRLSLGDIELF